MNFTEAMNTIELVTMTDDVPLIIGESGIGKTSMVRQIAKNNNLAIVNIDANLLKEGEIGGLPFVNNGRTEYATHYKLTEVSSLLKDTKYNGVILFIDELNRCEHAVQQELMNLILNREINGYRLDSSVKIIAAMNPSNKYDNFENSDYQVIDMDAAQEDRFVWVEVDSDSKEWIKWAMTDEADIEEEVIEFISQFPNYLHMPYANENIKPTPRSWERVSKAFKMYKNNKDKYSESIIFNVVKGNVGGGIATDFIGFARNFNSPLIKAEKLLDYDFIPYEIKEIIQKENHSRLYMLAKRLVQLLNEEENRDKIKLLGEVLMCYPKDLRLGVMKDIKEDYNGGLYKEILRQDTFIEAFFDIYE